MNKKHGEILHLEIQIMEFNIKASETDTIQKIANFPLFHADYYKLSFKLPKKCLPKKSAFYEQQSGDIAYV